MTVEDCDIVKKEGDIAKFPEGLEVLAVDDDATALKILSKQLTFCKYKVTTTNQAVKALELLRENKERFDLVISDVHMPDMDGFKLLELIGLEMDLPVIMLSVNGETDTVTRGITHGACDYLLKPVRMEELKLIWKHVIMRKSKQTPPNPHTLSLPAPTNNNSNNIVVNNDNVNNNNNINNNNNNVVNVVGNNNVGGGNVGGRGKRRIEEEEEEEEEERETQRKIKQRVVWSAHLHRKFVEAVNELGIDKAVPKRILEKMSVDQLTRENVASHLQKYRLYLKRLKDVNPHPAPTGLATRNPQIIQLSSLESFRNYHNSGRYRQYVPAMQAVHSYQSPPLFGTGQLAAATSAALNGPGLVPIPGAGQLDAATSAALNMNGLVPINSSGTVINTGGGGGNNNNNVVSNNQNNNNNNLFMGVAGTAMSTYSFYLTQGNNTNNNNNNNNNVINYAGIQAPQVGQITNLPPMGITGENCAVGTGDELHQIVASFNRMRNLTNNNNNNENNNNNLVNQSRSALFNPGRNVNINNSGMSFEIGTGTGTGTGNLAVDQLSSTNGDNSALNNIDDLLTAILKPMDGDSSLYQMDDMFGAN